MSHKAKVWSVLFLAVTATAIGMELVAALDSDPDTVPWTYLITDYLPAWLTAGLIGTLLVWLPSHFAASYLSRKGVVLPVAAPADANAGEAPKPSREPLLSVSAITAIGVALTGLAVALGVPMTDTQQTAILAVVAALAPLVVGLLARRTVYSPATVAALTADSPKE